MYNNRFLNIKDDESRQKQHKLIVLSVIIFFVMSCYLLCLFSMQILAGSEYRNQSVKISQRVKIIPAQRGEIFDRNVLTPVVSNTESFAIDITPAEIPSQKYDTVISKLAGYLGISKQSIDEKIPPKIRKSYTSIEIKSNVPLQTVSQIAENVYDLPGISWRSKPIRIYNTTGSMSHILGYVGNINNEELKVLYNKGYSRTSIVGKTGIEKQYDNLLQGTPGSETRTVDVKGKYMNEPPVIQNPVMGKNLVLTIDSKIQELAEKALGARMGSAIVLKPSTGEILAMASYPYYDLSIFNNDDTGPEYIKLSNDPNKPLLNRAINANYPPASTFKVIMSTAAYAENAIPPTKKIECKGELDYGNKIWHCHIGKPGHGHLDLKNALAQSCNIYYWTLGRDYLGIDIISSYAKQFGYGQPLGIDLPTSLAGFVPNALWKERRYHEKWVGGDTMNMSIGQSYTLVTPLHVADMMAMVVNKGTIYKPHILKQVRDPATREVITDVQKEVLCKMDDVPESVWEQVQNDLRYTITNGTAQFPLRNKIVQIAGKTGTAEIAGYTDHWHSWFVAYAPFDAPPEDAIVVVVSVEATNIWEWWAPYASNIIFQGYFADQTYEEAVDTLGFKYLMKPVGRQE